MTRTWKLPLIALSLLLLAPPVHADRRAKGPQLVSSVQRQLKTQYRGLPRAMTRALSRAMARPGLVKVYYDKNNRLTNVNVGVRSGPSFQLWISGNQFIAGHLKDGVPQKTWKGKLQVKASRTAGRAVTRDMRSFLRQTFGTKKLSGEVTRQLRNMRRGKVGYELTFVQKGRLHAISSTGGKSTRAVEAVYTGAEQPVPRVKTTYRTDSSYQEWRLGSAHTGAKVNHSFTTSGKRVSKRLSPLGVGTQDMVSVSSYYLKNGGGVFSQVQSNDRSKGEYHIPAQTR